MARIRAAVLAAGRGTRMGGKEPKTLIPVWGHEPLLYYILAGLKRAGVDDLLVVTGFGADAVQRYVTRIWGADDVNFVFNARYASWGNFHSVRMALEQSVGHPVMVVNSDVIVHPDVYKRLAGAEGDLVLTVERRHNLDEEDMRVEVRGNRVLQIGKDLKLARSHGEYTGVSLLRPYAASIYQQIATEWEWRAETTGYYEDIYGLMLDRVDARSVNVAEGEYAEVDAPREMEVAAHVIRRFPDAWPEAPAEPSEPEPAAAPQH